VAQVKWENAKILQRRATDPASGVINAFFDVEIGPRPAIQGDALARANALHAFHYICEEFTQELNAHSTLAQRKAYREGHLALAGITLAGLPDEQAPPSKTPAEFKASRAAIAAAVGIPVLTDS
jgi:hypothetical protein